MTIVTDIFAERLTSLFCFSLCVPLFVRVCVIVFAAPCSDWCGFWFRNQFWGGQGWVQHAFCNFHHLVVCFLCLRGLLVLLVSSAVSISSGMSGKSMNAMSFLLSKITTHMKRTELFPREFERIVQVCCLLVCHQNGTGLCTCCYVKGLREWCYSKLVSVETRINTSLQGLPSDSRISVLRHDSGTQLGYQ